MKPNSGLEGFVERHRADFDNFEPRADLWDAIEARLDEPADEDETPTHVLPLNPTVSPTHLDTPAATTPSFAWQRYVAAAAVAITLLAGGYGLRRADELSSSSATLASAADVLPAMEQQPSAVAEVVGAPEPMAVSAGQPAEQRLASSVRRMEAYYASQILEKQHELRQLDESAAPGTMPQAADWIHELTALDSTYRQLRTELYRNPDPDAVLEAMNRNLQIRLDILNQQLRTREQIRQYHDESYAEVSK
ncbi:anti-sigma factor [Solirubrum puertoriconensis]|uniref:anti-sigma factor n=1 Tax=Solirubrum puertoriconensis TaxID=1751427 RepID=UPI00122E3E8D|nr:anti-sigma factor [Solirubrum puertoriconensis]